MSFCDRDAPPPATPWGATTGVAPCPPAACPQQPVLEDPSPQVMKKPPPFLNAEEARMLGTTCASHASPVAIEQSCMSWHMLGVIHAKFGTVPLVRSGLS